MGTTEEYRNGDVMTVVNIGHVEHYNTNAEKVECTFNIYQEGAEHAGAYSSLCRWSPAPTVHGVHCRKKKRRCRCCTRRPRTSSNASVYIS